MKDKIRDTEYSLGVTIDLENNSHVYFRLFDMMKSIDVPHEDVVRAAMGGSLTTTPAGFKELIQRMRPNIIISLKQISVPIEQVLNKMGYEYVEESDYMPACFVWDGPDDG